MTEHRLPRRARGAILAATTLGPLAAPGGCGDPARLQGFAHGG